MKKFNSVNKCISSNDPWMKANNKKYHVYPGFRLNLGKKSEMIIFVSLLKQVQKKPVNVITG